MKKEIIHVHVGQAGVELGNISDGITPDTRPHSPIFFWKKEVRVSGVIRIVTTSKLVICIKMFLTDVKKKFFVSV